MLRDLLNGTADSAGEWLKPSPLIEWVHRQVGATAESGDVMAERVRAQTETFAKAQSLRDALGASTLRSVAEAVFAVDEFPPFAPGVPDILVWLHAPKVSCWFFSEVKAPADSMRESQKEWVAEHWDLVRGHYMFTMLE